MESQAWCSFFFTNGEIESWREKIKSWWLLHSKDPSIFRLSVSRHPICMRISYIKEKMHEPARIISASTELPSLGQLSVTWGAGLRERGLDGSIWANCSACPLVWEGQAGRRGPGECLWGGTQGANRIPGSFGGQAWSGSLGWGSALQEQNEDIQRWDKSGSMFLCAWAFLCEEREMATFCFCLAQAVTTTKTEPENISEFSCLHALCPFFTASCVTSAPASFPRLCSLQPLPCARWIFFCCCLYCLAYQTGPFFLII